MAQLYDQEKLLQALCQCGLQEIGEPLCKHARKVLSELKHGDLARW